MSDTSSHFKNRVIAKLSEALKVDHQYAVAYSAWSNGTCERMIKEVIRASKSILSEQRRLVSEWVDVFPAVQWALNTSYRERYENTPYCVMIGRASRTAFSAMASVSDGTRNVDVMDADQRAKVRGVVAEQAHFCHDVQSAVAPSREAKRKTAQGQGVSPR